MAWLATLPALAGVAACSSAHHSSGLAPTTSAASSTTSVAAATTVAASTVPPTTVFVPTNPQSSPDSAAGRLVAAWSDGNRTEASQVASPAAIATLFAIPYPAGYLQARGCTDPSTNPGTCTYRNTKTDAIYEITVSIGSSGWYVSGVTPET